MLNADWGTGDVRASLCLLFLPHCFVQSQQATLFEFGLKRVSFLNEILKFTSLFTISENKVSVY